MRKKIILNGLLEEDRQVFSKVLGEIFELVFTNNFIEYEEIVSDEFDLLFVGQKNNDLSKIIRLYKSRGLNIPTILISNGNIDESGFFDDFIFKPINEELLLYRTKKFIYNYRKYKYIDNELMIANNSNNESIYDSMSTLIYAYTVDLINDKVLSKANNDGEILEHNISYDELLNDICNNIEEEKDLFLSKFNRNKLLDYYENNQKNIVLSTNFNNESHTAVTVAALMYEKNGTIEAILRLYDITNVKFFQKINNTLLSQKYLSIGIIDIPTRKFNMLFKNGKRVNILYDFDDLNNKKVPNNYVLEGTDKYLEKSSMESILEGLSKYQQYFFTIKFYLEDDYKYIQYEYSYFSKDHKTILCLKSDVTKNVETDMLTGRLNRQGFIHCTTQTLKKSKINEYSLLYFNIKKFKAINELFGIDYGNHLLKHFTKKIEKCKVNPIYISRIEADQFACLVKTNDLDFEELNDVMHFEYSFNNKTIKVSAKLGIYIINEKLDILQMLDRAKLAKKFITDEYVKPYSIYDDSMKNSYMLKAMSQFDLERAIKNEELKVYYQPVIDCKTGEIASAEALIRWKHDTLGLVSPGEFLPALEETGDISKVDLYVVKKIVELYKKRKSQNKNFVPVSSNLSRMDLFDEDMMHSVIDDMKNDQEMKNIIRIEITETIYVNIEGRAKFLLDELRNLGTKMYIDDFGSGYSSLSTISDFDFDYLKLDMAFIKRIGDNDKVKNVIMSIISLAHSLDLKVVAEGVETALQFQFLKDNDCDYIQGYFFSKPLCEEEYELLLDSHEKMYS